MAPRWPSDWTAYWTSDRRARAVLLAGAALASLAGGTMYAYSAYSPQLGSKMHISNTSLNVIGLAGNVGSYATNPLFGAMADKRLHRLLFLLAFTFLFVGYMGMKLSFDGVLGLDATSRTSVGFVLLVVFSILIGAGGNAGLTASSNASVRSFSDKARSTVLGGVISFYGLSAFVFSFIGRSTVSDNTSAFLLVLVLGTSIPMLLAVFVVRPLESRKELGREDTHHSDSENPSSPSSHEDEGTSGTSLASFLKLFKNPDFWLLFVIVALLGGTGLMWMNNMGAIAQALVAQGHDSHWDRKRGAQYQALQVSLVSILNCLSRAITGLVSDVAKSKFSVRRCTWLILTAALLTSSQIAALFITSVSTLWVASALLGWAYGSLWCTGYMVTIEWFGIDGFSRNWGTIALSSVLGGNIFSVLFGANMDRHSGHAGAVGSSDDLQCYLGVDCYASTLKLSITACAIAFGLTCVAVWRDRVVYAAKDKTTLSSNDDPERQPLLR